MDGIVPVVIVIGVLPVPAAVVRFERVMRPANSGISASNNNALPRRSEVPRVRRMRVLNPRLDGRRASGLRRRFIDRLGLRKIILDARIAFYSRYVRSGRQLRSDLSSTFHQNGINNIERLMLDVAFAQPFSDWALGAPGLVQQRVINVTAFVFLGLPFGDLVYVRC